MQKIEKLLALLQVPQLGAHKIGRLLNDVDFDDLCRWDKTQLQLLGWNERQIRRWQQPDDKIINEALTWAAQENCRILTLFDEDYPFLLRQISTAPPVLFVKGNVSALALPQIAIVGSREHSHYGEYWAGQFATMLVQKQFAVTSGLAIGIDGICHRHALQANGTTIAVLGSGLNRLYPQRHRSLAEKIVEAGGALVSEFFPDQPPLAENFPRRNRIISGLSLGTLVIEAAINSGSLITARYALEQGREVFALPNAINSTYSQGCHKLIKDGAMLVDSIDDIVDSVALQMPRTDCDEKNGGEPNLPENKPKKIPPHKNAKPNPPTALNEESKPNADLPLQLTACQQQILACLSLEAVNVDDIAKYCELSVENVLIELLSLEMLDLAKSVSGGYVRVR